MHAMSRQSRRRVSCPALVCSAIGTLLLAGCGPRIRWLSESGARTTRVSNLSEPTMRVELARAPGYYLAASGRAPNEAYGKARQYLLVDVGYANPVVAISTKPLDPDPDAPYKACNEEPGLTSKSDYRCQRTLQLTLPVAFHLYWDAFSDNAPILDTDYTFGFDLSGRTAIWRNTEQRVGVYWGHISTHIGDEYTIAARAAGNRFPFDRVNVSYWPARVNASTRWYRPGNVGARSFIQLAAEAEHSCFPGLGCSSEDYYQLFPGEADPRRVPLIGPGTEGSVSLEGRHYVRRSTSGGITNDTTRPGAIAWGMSVARRRVFPYGLDPGRAWVPSVDVIAGYAVGVRPFAGARRVLLYSRFYSGPNPYGQFRNQRNYHFVGVGAVALP
jgi:hypothetical protein